MAYIKADEILTRIRELVCEGAGSVRTISSSRFQGGAHAGQSAAQQTRLGITSQKPVEIAIVSVEPHPQRLTIVGNVQIHRVVIEVRVIRTLDISTQVSDALRDDVVALGAQDADALSQVLEWPANLATTTGGSTTDLKSLTHEETRMRVEGNAGKAQSLVGTHRFSGVALSRPG